MSFIKCESCNTKILMKEKCMFAIYSKKIEGKEYFFCCEKCANQFTNKSAKKRKI